ncbi:MAG: PVC-type heme-binding CxxCH protein [Anditalea sp.]
MKKYLWSNPIAYVAWVFIFLSSCQSSADKSIEDVYDTLSEEDKRLPVNALKGLKIAEGLEANLFASEPIITNPTNIDVDHKGRVWVCEAYNYRPALTGNDPNPEGDRIMILEDTNGDGISDKETVFYQGPELNAPLGIWVMGNQAIVSQSPYVWLFTDTDGDDKADKKEIIFQGVDGEQHDHGMHAFVFGPDGKFYFNFGNEGGQIQDAQGNIIKDVNGKEVSPKNYKQGLVFRCNPDFTEFEVLGQNFRNNYEVAVDSYGTMWQSDNDDDGNRGVRINYVMEYGNYGYTDEITGAGWRANRTNKEAEIPEQHWHLNDPGVVPNLLQTGAGSPTGMVVYEGRLLPEVFWDQMIHSDAGPNVVRSYPVSKDGAGYKASIVNIMEGDKDQWFRPSDVCIAPDGSLIVSDWYDPGVGGHQAGDLDQGRIYRLAPPDTPYNIPVIDLNTTSGAIEALQNPNLSVRYQAWQKLNSLGTESEKDLAELFQTHENPRMRARALWLLTKIPNQGEKYIEEAIQDSNPDIRIVGLRAARQLKVDLVPYLKQLVDDADAQVRRESAIALRNLQAPETAELWAQLAMKHDGSDRWYLEALGIGAENQWDNYYTSWLNKVGDMDIEDAAHKDIVWRARTSKAIPLLASLASKPSVDINQRLRYFRAFDFNPNGIEKSTALANMLDGDDKDQSQVNKLVLTHLEPSYVRQSSTAMKALQGVLNNIEGTSEFVEMVQRFELKEENPRLLALTLAESDNNIGRSAASTLLNQGGSPMIRQVLNRQDEESTIKILIAIRGIGSKESLELLEDMVFNASAPLSVRREAAGSLGSSYGGENRVLELLKENKFPENLKVSAINGVSNTWRKSVRAEAASYLEINDTDNPENKLPPMKELIALEGDKDNGMMVFKQNCAICHQVEGMGTDYGPKLTEIGSKLSKEAQYISILHPDAGISFGFEGFMLNMKDGSTLGGIIASKTETDIDLKLPDGNVTSIKTSDIISMEQLENSMMPAGLENSMTTEELVDLVEYLMSLKRKS